MNPQAIDTETEFLRGLLRAGRRELDAEKDRRRRALLYTQLARIETEIMALESAWEPGFPTDPVLAQCWVWTWILRQAGYAVPDLLHATNGVNQRRTLPL